MLARNGHVKALSAFQYTTLKYDTENVYKKSPMYFP